MEWPQSMNELISTLETACTTEKYLQRSRTKGERFVSTCEILDPISSGVRFRKACAHGARARLACQTDRARLSYLCQVSCCNCRRSTGVRVAESTANWYRPQFCPARCRTTGTTDLHAHTAALHRRKNSAADVTEKFRPYRAPEAIRRSAPPNLSYGRTCTFHRLIETAVKLSVATACILAW